MDLNHDQGDIRIFKYRWVILGIYCLYTIINFMQFLEYTIIANIVQKYYDIDSSLVDASGLAFFLVFIILFLPVSFSIEKYSLKFTALISALLTLAGTVVKIFGDDPSRFVVVLIGQALCAIGQVFMLSVPTKLASVWFGAEEVSTACAIAVVGTQLGAALGAICPPFLVDKNGTDEEIGRELRNMNIYYTVFAAVAACFVAIFFRSGPAYPPSMSQLNLLKESETQTPFLSSCKKILQNRDFLLLLIFFGLFNGLWNAFGILVNNIYIQYFPDGETDVGIITLIAIISGGCIGSFIFGYILDKTHAFKKISLIVTVLACLTFLLVFCSLHFKQKVATYFTIPLFGFFNASGILICIEYAVEVTYPIPESVSCSIINAVCFFFGILATLALEGLMDAIGYTYTFILIAAAFLCCTLGLLLVSSTLRRRDANVAANRRLEVAVNGQDTDKVTHF